MEAPTASMTPSRPILKFPLAEMTPFRLILDASIVTSSAVWLMAEMTPSFPTVRLMLSALAVIRLSAAVIRPSRESTVWRVA